MMFTGNGSMTGPTPTPWDISRLQDYYLELSIYLIPKCQPAEANILKDNTDKAANPKLVS